MESEKPSGWWRGSFVVIFGILNTQRDSIETGESYTTVYSALKYVFISFECPQTSKSV